MSELVARFQRLLAELPGRAPGSSIDLLLHTMDPESAAQLRLCAIPHAFTPSVLQALVPGLDAARAEQQCRAFGALSMVVAGPDGLAMHDEARRYLFTQWFRPEVAGDFAAASSRLVAYFEQATAATDQALEIVHRRRMFHLLGIDQAKGFAEFERQCRRARREMRLSDCANLIRLAHEYDAVLAPEWATRLAYHEGKLASDLRDWTRARQLFDRVLSDATAPPDLRVKTLLRVGFIFCEERSWPAAIEHYQQALEIARTVPESRDQIHHILSSLGEAHRDSGDLETAERLLVESLALAEATGDPSELANIHNSLGTLHFKRREIPEAISAYQRSLAYLTQTQDPFRSAQVHNNLGMVYSDLREWTKAEQFYQESLATKRQAGDSVGQARTLTNLVRVYRNLNHSQQAIEACHQALMLFGEVRDLHSSAQAQRTLGKLYASMGSLEPARQAFEDAAELLERCGAADEAQATWRELRTLGARVGLPWWAWTIIVLIVGFVALVLLVALLDVLGVLPEGD
jgi:tetratricopeptide (TPR) repeat protein